MGRNGEVIVGNIASRLPGQDDTGWITAVKGVQKVADSGAAPNVLTLHFRERQFTSLDHVHELMHRAFLLSHLTP